MCKCKELYQGNWYLARNNNAKFIRKKKKIFQRLTPFITGKKKVLSTKPHIEKYLRAKPEMVGSVLFCYSSGNLTGLGTELGPLPVPHLHQEEPAIVTEETKLKKDPHRHPRSFPFPTTGSFVLISHRVAQTWPNIWKEGSRKERQEDNFVIRNNYTP